VGAARPSPPLSLRAPQLVVIVVAAAAATLVRLV
jgi:hypothetical protein